VHGELELQKKRVALLERELQSATAEVAQAKGREQMAGVEVQRLKARIIELEGIKED
jgi:hypothetical protein